MEPKASYETGLYILFLFLGLTLLAGCCQNDSADPATLPASGDIVFSYDQSVIPGVKPWTSENFRNDPDNFQFAIIGDRTGGANVQRTFELAMDQLNLLQPEFVINVGDIIEGYTRDKKVYLTVKASIPRCLAHMIAKAL